MANGIVGQNSHRPLSLAECRAFALIDDYAPLIFINSNDTRAGKLFSLFHEAVHIWTGGTDLYDRQEFDDENDKGTERFCNAVAAEIIMPETLFVEEWDSEAHKFGQPSGDDINKLCAKIAQKYGCSTTVIARRAMNRSYISRNKYNEIAQTAIRFADKRKNNSGGNYYATQASRYDHNFIRALYHSMREGEITPTEVYRLSNSTRKTFPKLVHAIGGGAYD
jgi:Zn-dependent peptidase ImmA (M78 family)